MAATMQAPAAAARKTLFISNSEDDNAAAAGKKSINLSLSGTAAIGNASAIPFMSCCLLDWTVLPIV